MKPILVSRITKNILRKNTCESVVRYQYCAGRALDREPFSEAAVQLFAHVERDRLTGYLCGTIVTTVYYLARKVVGSCKAEEELKKLLRLFKIASVNRVVLEAAIETGFSDFEDVVLYEAARHAGAEAIVTRNAKDFTLAEIPIYTSSELALMLERQPK